MDDYGKEYNEDDISNERIEALLDKISDIVENSQRGMFGNIRFDKAEVLDLIDDLRGEIPNEVRRAQDVLRKRDSIIREAESEAEKIRSDAEAEAQRIVSQHETTRAANEWASQREREIADYYREMCIGANRYAEECLSKVERIIEIRLEEFKRTSFDTEDELRRSLNEITKNKATLTDSFDDGEYQEN